MSKTVLHVKTDESIKLAAQQTARDIGVSLSTVVTALLNDFVKHRSITLAVEPTVRPDIVALFEQAEKEPLTKNSSPVFSEAGEAVHYLDNANV